MAAVVLKSSAYVIELLTELAFGQATCLLTAIVSLHLLLSLSLPAASAGVCLSAKLRKDSAKGHAAEGGRGRGRGRSSTAAAAVAKGVGARTLFYALHALRRKVLIGSTQHTALPCSPPAAPSAPAPPEGWQQRLLPQQQLP